MHLHLRTSIRSARASLMIALGLASACGDPEGTTAASATEGSTGTTTGDTTQGTSTGGSAGTTATTSSGSVSDSATTSTSTTGATTASTSSSGTSTGAETTSGTTTATTTGTTSDTNSGTTADTSSGTTGVDPECVPLMQGFIDPPIPSGWVQCADKLPHRVEAVTCEVPAAPTNCMLNEPNQQCHTNADCDAQPFGSCQQFSIGLITCGCVYGCETDADCDAGFVCRCGGDVLGPTTTCVPSECADDDACPDGEVCQFALAHGTDCAPEVVDGACTTPNDFCESDAPCGGDPCTYNGDSWACTGLICGRPFYVDARAVTAEAVEAEGWRAAIDSSSATSSDPSLAVSPAASHAMSSVSLLATSRDPSLATSSDPSLATSPVASLTTSLAPAPVASRRALIEHWTTIALAEHASIASFARFILQLLAVGAPASLVQAANEALADEVEHARLAFALASHYRGAAIGAGPLPHVDAPLAQDLEAVVAAVLREACVGETLSALEVREAAARAEEPALRRILDRIADDERRHAELGWRFVAWALPRLDADAQARAYAAFDDAIASAEAAARAEVGEAGAPELRPYGVIDRPLRAAVHLDGLRDLVTPVAAALRAAA